MLADTPDFVQGTDAYGLQRASVRLSWAPAPGGTRFVLQGSSDDAWGKGAKSALERLEGALRNADVPGYQPDRMGMHPGALVGILIGFVFLVMALIPFLRGLVFGC